RGFTAGSAWVNHDPDGGTIRAGKRADLAILDRDIFEPPSTGTGIGDARVEYTLAGGKIVHQAQL
ncbi:MAG TPA: amidohydrolase family protein, partial [Kineosporiaceae bacterium]|nr:amidohydrolase family protein [Kineosporiaceae bacterium]